MQCFKQIPLTKLHTHTESHTPDWQQCFFSEASRGQTSQTASEKQRSLIWTESEVLGGMKGRTSWQQQNHRQSRWHSAEIPSETSTKLQWHFAFLHCLSTSEKLSKQKCFSISHAHSPTCSTDPKSIHSKLNLYLRPQLVSWVSRSLPYHILFTV